MPPLTRIATLSLLALLAACASPLKPMALDSASAPALAKAEVLRAYTAAPRLDVPPTFWGAFFGTLLLGPVGGALAQVENSDSEGGRLRAMGLQDPGLALSLGLQSRLAPRHGGTWAAQAVTLPEPPSANGQLPEKAGLPDSARYVLALETLRWGMVPFGIDARRMRIVLSAQAQLIDREKSQNLAQGNCRYRTEDWEHGPTAAELQQDEARRLKSEMDVAVQACVEQLASQMTTGS